MGYVLEGAEIVMLCIPSSFIEYYAELMSSHINNDQIIFFNMAAAMGSARFIKVLEEYKIETRPIFAEANTLTYGTRVNFETASVDLSLNVRKVYFSTLNEKDLTKPLKSGIALSIYC